MMAFSVSPRRGSSRPPSPGLPERTSSVVAGWTTWRILTRRRDGPARNPERSAPVEATTHAVHTDYAWTRPERKAHAGALDAVLSCGGSSASGGADHTRFSGPPERTVVPTTDAAGGPAESAGMRDADAASGYCVPNELMHSR